MAKQLLYGSLFSGIGGMDLGFDRAGMKCAWQVEINPYARKVLAKHWPEVPKHDDITTFKGKDWPWVDVIAGGFPCQDISYAGPGAGINGQRSGLFFEFARIVSEMGPRVIVLENVAALLCRGMGDVLGTLASLGYDCRWDCIPAAAVGAPHIRDRVFIVGCRMPNADSDRRPPRSGDIGSEAKAWCPRRSFAQRLRRTLSDANGKGFSKRKSERSDSSEKQPTIERSDWWAVEPAVGRVANGVPSRVDRLRGLGNAVVPQVAEFIARRIVEADSCQTTTPKPS